MTSVAPSICLANSLTSATDLAMRTPPLSPAEASLNLPLPRPPAWIWLFTTQIGPGSDLRGRVGILRPQHRDALGDRHAEFVQQRLGLVFVDVHLERSPELFAVNSRVHGRFAAGIPYTNAPATLARRGPAFSGRAGPARSSCRRRPGPARRRPTCRRRRGPCRRARSRRCARRPSSRSPRARRHTCPSRRIRR